MIAEYLDGGDVLWGAATETDAVEIARALAVAAPQAQVVLMPESDALPGGDLPASPGNVGRRQAALETAQRQAGAQCGRVVRATSCVQHPVLGITHVH